MQVTFCQEDINRIKDAYWMGRIAWGHDPSDWETPLNDALVSAITDRLPKYDRTIASKCRNLSDQGVTAMKRGAPQEALELLRRAEETLTEPIYWEASLFGNIGLQAGRAYLDFRSGDFAKASERLLLALTLEDELENDFGYPILQIHRIHLVENLIRVCWRAGEGERAVQLTGYLLSYLSGGLATHLPGTWQPGNLSSVGIEVIRGKFISVFNLFAVELAQLDPVMQQAALRGLDGIAESEPAALWLVSGCFLWSRFVWHALTGRISEGVQYLTEYLATGMLDNPMLWVIVVSDLAQSITKDDSAELHNRLVNDLRWFATRPGSVRKIAGSALSVICGSPAPAPR